MGLDMYLNAKRHLWYNEDDLKTELADAFPELGEVEITSVVAEAGYWRKCNQIHKWFVDNVQKGVDDCGLYDVNREDLQKLLDIVREVLANPEKASELLPSQGGFFFGSTDYNEYYFEDLKQTERILLNALDPKWERWYFQYQSSW